MAETVGILGEDDSKRKGIQRLLNQYEFDAIEADHDLFQFKRGGGEKRDVTRYGVNHLNLAAAWINRQIASSPQHANLTVLIDECITDAIAQFLPSRKFRIWKAKGKEVKAKRHRRTALRERGKPLTQETNLSASPKCKQAIDLAAQGFRVFPLHTPAEGKCSCKRGIDCDKAGKHPRVRNWGQVATTGVHVINEWWAKWPDANVGILTGTKLVGGGVLTVLDVDRRSFGHGSLACWQDEIDGDLPDTLTVTTGDGFQFYFSVTDGLPNSNGLLGHGLDVKCLGGYVVGPGSAHASGKTYTVTNLSPIEPMPEAMVNHLRDVRLRRSVPVGERHNFLKRCARRLACAGLGSDQIFLVLQDRLNRFCELGGRLIADEELLRLAAWAQSTEQYQANRIQTA